MTKIRILFNENIEKNFNNYKKFDKNIWKPKSKIFRKPKKCSGPVVVSGGGIIVGGGTESSHLPAKATPIWLHLASHALEYVIPS